MKKSNEVMVMGIFNSLSEKGEGKRASGGAASVKVVSWGNGGHGSHWKTVFSDLSILAPMVNEVFNDKGSVTKMLFTSFAGRGERPLASHKFDLGNEVSSVFTFVELEKWEFATAYPFVKSNQGNSLDVTEIKQWSNEVEAIVSGKVRETALNFFATDYFLNKEKYSKNEISKVDLSAFAYSVATNDSTKKQVIQANGKEYDFSKAEVVLPMDLLRKGAWPDDYHVRAKVTEVTKVSFRGVEAFILEVSLSLIGRLKIFARIDALDKSPKVGDYIDADVWLQGQEYGQEWLTLSG